MGIGGFSHSNVVLKQPAAERQLQSQLVIAEYYLHALKSLSKGRKEASRTL